MDLTLFFRELTEYNKHCNADLITYLENNSSRISGRALLLTGHVLNAHAIWNARIKGESQPFQVWEEHTIDELKAIDENNHHSTSRIVEQYPYERIIDYRTSRGESRSNTVRDIFFHIINHSTYHRGQIATELRAEGLQPLISDYIYYKL